MAGTWMRLAHVALSSAGDTIDSGTFTAKKNLKVIVSLIPSGGIEARCRFNDDSGSNYAYRKNSNGEVPDGNPNTSITYNDMYVDSNLNYQVMYIINKADKEKLTILHNVGNNSAGAGNAPLRREYVGKWANTSAAITNIKIINGGSGDFASGSYITVLGATGDVITDEKTTLTNVSVGTRYEETDTRKIYRFATTSSSHSLTGTDSTSGIDVNLSDPRGGWGQQIKSGHPLVGKKLKTFKVKTRFSSNIAGRSDKDMTVKVFAGTTSSIRGTSQAISTSTLTTAGTWYEKTFTFTNAVELSADDCICVCVDGNTGSSGGWNANIRESNEDSGKGYWVAFQDATNPTGGSIQTGRSLQYTATYEQDEWKERGSA